MMRSVQRPLRRTADRAVGCRSSSYFASRHGCSVARGWRQPALPVLVQRHASDPFSASRWGSAGVLEPIARSSMRQYHLSQVPRDYGLPIPTALVRRLVDDVAICSGRRTSSGKAGRAAVQTQVETVSRSTWTNRETGGEYMKKPEHLCRFPCMEPWIGPKYGCDERRLAVVGESHYLPPRVTRKNYTVHRHGISTRQENVPDIDDSHSYMNTRKCVQRRDESDNHTYKVIDDVVSFEEIAFFNYLVRPSEHGKPGYSLSGPFDILDDDRAVSSEIMEWFIQTYCPTSIVIASATVMRYSCVRCDLAAHPKIDTCVTAHPRNTNPFSSDVRSFLEDKSFRGSKADLPLSLKQGDRARCRSHPWRMRGGS